MDTPAADAGGARPDAAVAVRSGPVAGSKARHLGHVPALDYVRGTAWLLVFIDHTGLVKVVTTGQVAMFLFFGLSGFLITALLAAERADAGHVSLRDFFVRRGLRLLPGLTAFLLIWLAVVAVFGRSGWVMTVPTGHPRSVEPFTVALEAAGAAMAYVTNWFDLFNVFTGYVAIGHLWSLAVEEQFYLFWAPCLVLLLVRGRRAALAGAVLLAVASFADVAFIQHAQSTTNWVFRSTDTRAGTFLVGAALAVWWTGRPQLPAWWLRLTMPVAWATVLAVCWAGWAFAHNPSYLIYNAAWITVSLAAPLLTVALASRPGPGSPRAASPRWVMGYLGRRSYALYLWHYPWLTWLRDLGRPGIVVALAASLASAELSWRLVEAPALRLKRRFAPGRPPPATARPDATSTSATAVTLAAAGKDGQAEA